MSVKRKHELVPRDLTSPVVRCSFCLHERKQFHASFFHQNRSEQFFNCQFPNLKNGRYNITFAFAINVILISGSNAVLLSASKNNRCFSLPLGSTHARYGVSCRPKPFLYLSIAAKKGIFDESYTKLEIIQTHDNVFALRCLFASVLLTN